MKNLIPTIILYLLCLAAPVSAQNETSKWYFGSIAGLDFMTNPPTGIANSAMYAAAPGACMADAAGNLLFYAHSLAIYNAQNVPMANGTGLQPNNVGAPYLLAVKKPGSASIYYVFKANTPGPVNGLQYHTIDMSLAAGLGSVVAKNDVVYPGQQTIKLAATQHCNGTDIWIMTADLNSTQFRAFLVTAAGINTIGVVSTAPLPSNFVNAGQMKFSPNGRRLAVATGTIFALFDFDNSTGVVSNYLGLVQNPFSNSWQASGCEFSPDGSKLYGSGGSSNRLFKWDLAAGSNSAIAASLYTYTNVLSPIGTSGTRLQLAINGNMYLDGIGMNALGVITNPNLAGPASAFNPAGQSVSTGSCNGALPQFMSSYFRQTGLPAFSVNSQVSCLTATFSTAFGQFTNCPSCTGTPLSYSWAFGDPASGSSNNSSQPNPLHTFSAPGTYTVHLSLNYNCYSDTVKTVITVNGPAPTLNIAGIPTVCAGQNITLIADGADTYTWNTGVNTPYLWDTPFITTSYQVIGTTSNTACPEVADFVVTVTSCVGLEETGAKDQALLFPNPFENSVELHHAAGSEIELFSVSGQLLLKERVSGSVHKIATESLRPGIYFLRISNLNFTETKKLIRLD